jgi:branched-chain amino acid transport system substrate-binding protein
MGKTGRIIVVAVLALALIAGTTYLVQSKTDLSALVQQVLLANLTPKQVREQQGISTDRIVKIGVVGPETSIKRNTLLYQGIQMAVDEIAAAGGVLGMKLEVVFQDDGNTLDRTLGIAQEFAADTDVSFVIGHWTSDHTIPAAQIYDQAGVILLAPTTTNPLLTQKGYSSAFRLSVTDAETGAKMAAYAKSQGFQKIAVYYSDSLLGKALSLAFEASAKADGIDVIDRVSNFIDKAQFDKAYAKWKTQGVDAVFIADAIGYSTGLITWIREKDANLPILAADGFDYSMIIEKGDRVAMNFAFTTLSRRIQNEAAYADFEIRFKAKYGLAPDYYAVLGYDTIMIARETLETAKSTAPSALIDVLASGRAYQGVNGKVAFDGLGNLTTGEVFIRKVVEGRFVTVQ